MAASAITAGVTQGVGEAIGGANWQNSSSLSDFSKFAIDAGSRFIGGTVAQAVTNKGGRVNFGQVAADAFGNALGNSIAQGIAGGGSQQADRIPSNAGYRNEMDRQSGAYRPAMNYNYRNGYDVQSDAYNPATEYGYRNGMDIDSDNFKPASAYNYRNGADVQSDNFNPASAYGYRNGGDVQSDSFVRALNQQAKAKSAGMTQAALSVPAGTGGTIKPYDDMQRLWANSRTRGLAGPSGADLIPRDGPYLAPPVQTTSNGGVTGYLLDKLDAFQRSPWGHALQGLPPEGFIVGGAKAGLLWAGRVGKAESVGNLGSAGSLAIEETVPLLAMSRQPGVVIKNALSNAEFAQAQELASFRGGKFIGAPTDSFPGIDGWLDGVPTQLKIVTGNGEQAILRNIVKGARNMSAQGYVGDIAVDATRTGATIESFTKFVTPNTPVGRILNEGSVNNVYVKFSNGWLNITQGTIVVPGR